MNEYPKYPPLKSTLLPLCLLFSWLLSAQSNNDSPIKYHVVGGDTILFNGWSNIPDALGFRYCEGKLCNGLVVDTFENGSIQKHGYYLNGSQHGEFVEYYENGTVKSKREYRRGNPIGKWCSYYPDGSLEGHSIFSGEMSMPFGALELYAEYYYPNGNLAERTRRDSAGYRTFDLFLSESGDTLSLHTVFDEENSIYKGSWFYENGQLKEVEYYQYLEKTYPIGIWREYDIHGNLLSEKEYPSDFHLDW